MLCRGLEKNGMVRAGHGHGMASVNHTRPHCVNQLGKTHSKPLAAWHGRGMAWVWHATCESALRFPRRPVPLKFPDQHSACISHFSYVPYTPLTYRLSVLAQSMGDDKDAVFSPHLVQFYLVNNLHLV